MHDPDVPKNSDGTAKVDEDDCCDSFQSQGNVIIYAIRHGETVLNKDNRFRGWIEVPLNKTGIEQAKRTRKYLADKGIKEVFCSDLGRARHTAKIAMPSISAESDSLLRPWDVGDFSGQPKEPLTPALNHHINNPKIPLPNGESLKEFSDRQKKAFAKYLKIAQKSGPILLVFHTSNIIQIEKIVEGKNELGRPEEVDRVPPGGVLVVLDEGDKLKVEIPFGEKEDRPANYGS